MRIGSPLTRDQFISHLKEALSSCGIDNRRYPGHSFQIVAATAAAQAGVPDHLIKVLGRWELENYQLYIQTPQLLQQSPQSYLVVSTPSLSFL